MMDLVLGVVVFGVALALFKLCLPHGGETRWFVGTQWEPYVAVGITLALVVGLGLVLAGAIGLVL